MSFTNHATFILICLCLTCNGNQYGSCKFKTATNFECGDVVDAVGRSLTASLSEIAICTALKNGCTAPSDEFDPCDGQITATNIVKSYPAVCSGINDIERCIGICEFVYDKLTDPQKAILRTRIAHLGNNKLHTLPITKLETLECYYEDPSGVLKMKLAAKSITASTETKQNTKNQESTASEALLKGTSATLIVGSKGSNIPGTQWGTGATDKYIQYDLREDIVDDDTSHKQVDEKWRAIYNIEGGPSGSASAIQKRWALSVAHNFAHKKDQFIIFTEDAAKRKHYLPKTMPSKVKLYPGVNGKATEKVDPVLVDVICIPVGYMVVDDSAAIIDYQDYDISLLHVTTDQSKWFAIGYNVDSAFFSTTANVFHSAGYPQDHDPYLIYSPYSFSNAKNPQFVTGCTGGGAKIWCSETQKLTFLRTLLDAQRKTSDGQSGSPMWYFDAGKKLNIVYGALMSKGLDVEQEDTGSLWVGVQFSRMTKYRYLAYTPLINVDAFDTSTTHYLHHSHRNKYVYDLSSYGMNTYLLSLVLFGITGFIVGLFIFGCGISFRVMSQNRK